MNLPILVIEIVKQLEIYELNLIKHVLNWVTPLL